VIRDKFPEPFPRSSNRSNDKQACAISHGHCPRRFSRGAGPDGECGCRPGRGRIRSFRGTINIEQAIFATNEGRRDFEALGKKLEPKQTELKGQNDELDSLKKQLNTQGDKLNDDARATLVKQIETKQKSLDRAVQDAREDAQNQQNEIAQRILQKLAPVLVKYANENGFGVIIDTSQPWPQGPVVWWGQSVDVTKPVVEAYNTQSGVPAPAATVAPAAKPASTHPAGTTNKPAPAPAKTNQPPK
jgi:outer membrane protein